MSIHTDSEDVAWATIRATLVPACFSGEDPASALDRLEGLAAVVAEDPRVGGVETRDPTTLEFACEIPELIVYTTPAAVADLSSRVSDLAPTLGLQLEVGCSVHNDDSWRDHWKTFYRSQVFGDGTLLLRPSWIERTPSDPKLEVVIDPGRAFGTGLHESTRLCLEVLAGILNRHYQVDAPPLSMLDLGCGSGILSLAAARLFDTLDNIIAVDIDPEAATTTRENAELNGLGDRLKAIAGTVSDLDLGEGFSLVVANIRPKVLIPDAAAIKATVAPHCFLVLSGILTDEASEVAQAYKTPEFKLVASPEQGDWCALVFRRVPA